MVNKILAEFGVPVDELPGGAITMHERRKFDIARPSRRFHLVTG